MGRRAVFAALAGSSEVLVSSTVRDIVTGSRRTFADRAGHELKGVPEHWRVYALVTEHTGRRLRATPTRFVPVRRYVGVIAGEPVLRDPASHESTGRAAVVDY